VYVTIDVQDVTDPEISVTTTGETSEVSFKAVGGTDKEPYALKFATFKAVDEEKSKWAVGPRHVVFVLIKKEEGYWERLLAAGVKMNNLKVGSPVRRPSQQPCATSPAPSDLRFMQSHGARRALGCATHSPLGADLIVRENPTRGTAPEGGGHACDSSDSCHRDAFVFMGALRRPVRRV
jgi:hypothetical protein